MRKVGQLTSWLIGIFWCSFAAAQVLTVSDNTTAKVKISGKEPTRISVDSDRIAVLRGVEGAYTFSNDNNGGAVFLKPTEAYQQTPFYLFVSTEQGHNYVLLLHPTTTLSAGILILKSRAQEMIAAKQWETESPYADTLTKLIVGMVNRSTPEGYEATHVSGGKTLLVGKKLQLRLQTRYSGAHLKGEIYEVTNRSKMPVKLSECIFYHPGDRAIALRDKTIAGGGKTLLYKVMTNE